MKWVLWWVKKEWKFVKGNTWESLLYWNPEMRTLDLLGWIFSPTFFQTPSGAGTRILVKRDWWSILQWMQVYFSPTPTWCNLWVYTGVLGLLFFIHYRRKIYHMYVNSFINAILLLFTKLLYIKESIHSPTRWNSECFGYIWYLPRSYTMEDLISHFDTSLVCQILMVQQHYKNFHPCVYQDDAKNRRQRVDHLLGHHSSLQQDGALWQKEHLWTGYSSLCLPTVCTFQHLPHGLSSFSRQHGQIHWVCKLKKNHTSIDHMKCFL